MSHRSSSSITTRSSTTRPSPTTSSLAISLSPSGRDGGVKPEKSTDEGPPKLKQGETLSGLRPEGESESAKAQKKMVNINGGYLVDPAYREVGDGGDAGNEGNLGAEEKGKGKGEVGSDGGQGKKRDAKL